jgi:hypothetical protein
MTKPMITINDLATNQIIEREMTTAEFKQYETDQATQAAIKAQAEAKATARQAVLDRLGLTAEEAQLLLGGN